MGHPDKTETTPAAPGYREAKRRWETEYRPQVKGDDVRRNRSGIELKPLYGPDDWDSARYMADLGLPGQEPTTRGIHASMYRGRPWSPRMVVGFGTPEDYNKRMRDLYALGLTGLFVSPCNSHLRGYDPDEVERELLGTCGTLISTSDDMGVCMDGIPFDSESISVGDTAPYTLTAMLIKVAKQRGIQWQSLVGTTNQSDYLSHYAALHMFYRLDLPGQKRVLLDHIDWMNRNVPRWNPISIVGQHMQQAGATPAEAMGLTLSSAIQYANDMIERGKQPDDFLPRFSFFFDISISFFEEIAKFRAGRRVWNRLVRERFGAKDPRSGKFRFHAQTSGVDLTRQQPLNNIARVTVHAMAGILGGLQSMHTDSYDEAICIPTETTARIAVATQNILREEAHLGDVIDPLGGSYYVEALTNAMEEKIMAVIEAVDAQGGMFAAVKSGFVQKMIGQSALAFQQKIESRDEIVVGVNEYVYDGPSGAVPPALERPDGKKLDAYLAKLHAFRERRDAAKVAEALDRLGEAFSSPTTNTYEKVVEAIDAGATHGEVCHRVREAVGFGQPLVVV
ncbi:MAG: acyl-CoA mutase large subunit family protein [Rhodocyclaceae bacterium]|nr:acyl-CoA mutase large subunit family protein [Rhodocyclaceae bacterium]